MCCHTLVDSSISGRSKACRLPCRMFEWLECDPFMIFPLRENKLHWEKCCSTLSRGTSVSQSTFRNVGFYIIRFMLSRVGICNSYLRPMPPLVVIARRTDSAGSSHSLVDRRGRRWELRKAESSNLPIRSTRIAKRSQKPGRCDDFSSYVWKALSTACFAILKLSVWMSTIRSAKAIHRKTDFLRRKPMIESRKPSKV